MQVFPKALVQSRTCYKHLAGEIGVAVTRALLKQGCIENAAVQQKHCFTITPTGYKWCAKYGIAEYLAQGSGGLAKSYWKTAIYTRLSACRIRSSNLMLEYPPIYYFSPKVSPQKTFGIGIINHLMGVIRIQNQSA